MQTAVDAGPTRNAQLILQLVDGVYAAGCGEATWDQVLASICRLGRLDGAALSTVGADEPQRILLASFGLGPGINPGPLRGAMAHDWRLVDSMFKASPATVLREHRMMSDPTIASTRWRGAGPVQGSSAWACVIVGKDGRRGVCLEVYRLGQRAPGCLEPHELLRDLASHLVRAWRLGAASRPGPVTPLPIEARSLSQSEVAQSADFAGQPDTARLRAEFGLTKAEARLALRLARGSSLASAAQAFDVKLTTIRSQLQQIFAKTGTSRQPELVAMLLSRGGASQAPHGRPHVAMPAEAAFAG